MHWEEECIRTFFQVCWFISLDAEGLTPNGLPVVLKQ